MNDPLIIIVGVVLVLLVGGSLAKFVSKAFRFVGSALMFVLIVCVVATIAGIDLPYLP